MELRDITRPREKPVPLISLWVFVAWDKFYRDKITKVVDHASRKQCSMTRKKRGSRDDKDTTARGTHEEFGKTAFPFDSLIEKIQDHVYEVIRAIS